MAIQDYQQQFGIQEAIQAERQKKDDVFWSGLMYHAMRPGKINVSAGTYNDDAAALPSKDAAYNQFLQMRNGRLSTQEMMAFNQGWEQMDQMRASGLLQELNRAKAAGMSDKKLRNMVGNNPSLYNNLLDMTGKLSMSGDEQAMALSAQYAQYLPKKSGLDKKVEWVKDNPVYTAGIAATGTYINRKFGLITGDRIKGLLNKNPEYVSFLDDVLAENIVYDYNKKDFVYKPGRGGRTTGGIAREGRSVIGKDRKAVKLLEQDPKFMDTVKKGEFKSHVGGKLGKVGFGVALAAPYIGRALAGEAGEDIGYLGSGIYFGGRAIGNIDKVTNVKKLYDQAKATGTLKNMTAGVTGKKAAARLAKFAGNKGRLGKLLLRIAGKAGIRHAAVAGTGIGAHPIAQAALVLLDLGFAIWEIQQFLSEE